MGNRGQVREGENGRGKEKIRERGGMKEGENRRERGCEGRR